MIENWETLSDKELLFGYKELVLFVEAISKKPGRQSANILAHFKTSNSQNKYLQRRSVKSHEIRDFSDMAAGNYIDFINNKGNQVVSILTHLRNSYSHGLFCKNSISHQSVYLFEDYWKNKITMRAKLKASDFVEIVTLLKKCLKNQ